MRGSIRKRGKDSWTIILSLGYETDPETGRKKRKQKWLACQGTKRDAERKLAELLHSANRGEFVEPSKMTLSEWLDTWLSTVIEPRKRTRTIETYKSVVKNHLKPALGPIRLQALQPTDLQAYYNAAKVSETTKEQHHTILHGALEAARKLGYVARNVATLVPHKPRRPDSPEDVLENCWNAAEARKFLVAAGEESPQAHAFYTVALQSGMRKGELCGLKWSDVDLAANTVTVARTLLKPGSEPVFGPPKNGQARTVKLSADTMRLLRKHKLRQDELRMKNRLHYHEHGLVFAKEWGDLQRHGDTLGDPLQMNNIGQRQFARLIEAAGVKKITFHGMRHTAATLAFQAGALPHEVQKMLGHKRVEITLAIYAHVLPDRQEEMAAKLSALLQG